MLKLCIVFKAECAKRTEKKSNLCALCVLRFLLLRGSSSDFDKSIPRHPSSVFGRTIPVPLLHLNYDPMIHFPNYHSHSRNYHSLFPLNCLDILPVHPLIILARINMAIITLMTDSHQGWQCGRDERRHLGDLSPQRKFRIWSHMIGAQNVREASLILAPLRPVFSQRHDPCGCRRSRVAPPAARPWPP